LIPVDSEPLHFSRFARCPVLGLWLDHQPSYYTLPKPEPANICPARQTGLTRHRRLDFNIIECAQDRLDGGFVAEQAARMLGPRIYLRDPDLVLRHLVDRLRHYDCPLTSFVDRHRTFAGGGALGLSGGVARGLSLLPLFIRS
jgi:hypothetical protein